MALRLRTLSAWSLKAKDPKRANNIRPLFNSLTHYTSANTSKLANGIRQRDNILPATPLQQEENGIGYYQPNVITDAYGSSMTNHDSLSLMPVKLRERHCRIFVPADNHMHYTPVVSKGKKWAIQFERQALYKTPNMGWTFSDDTFSSGQLGNEIKYFDSLEECIDFCRHIGVAYDIKYPRRRYVAKKDYADNFVWKGEPQGLEDIA